MNKIKTLTIALLGMLFSAVVFCLPAYADPATITDKTITIPYPVVGESIPQYATTDDEAPNWVDSSMVYWRRMDTTTHGWINYYEDKNQPAMFSGFGGDYGLYMQYSIAKNKWDRPTEDGWKLRLYDAKSGLEKIIVLQGKDVTVSDQGTEYMLQATPNDIKPINDAKFFYINNPTEWIYHVGDTPNYDITTGEYSYYMQIDESSIRWSLPGSPGKEIPKGEKITQEGFYKLTFEVSILDEYKESHVFRDSSDYTCEVPYPVETDFVKLQKDKMKLEFKVPFSYTIDELTVKGIKEPVAGEKPVAEGISLGINLSSGEESGDFGSANIPEGKQAQWSGNFAADGSFKEGETYTIKIPYCLTLATGYLDFDQENGFAKDKIHAGKATVVSDEAGSVDVNKDHGNTYVYRTLTLSYTLPRTTATITFDPGEGTGTMDPVTVSIGSAYTLPACTLKAPEGKAFDKWDAGAPGESIKPDKDLVIKAIWKDGASTGGNDKDGKIADGTKEGETAPVYEIIKGSGKKAEKVAACNGITGSGAGEATAVTIPDTVTIDGVKYKVESIATGAFLDNTKLKKVTIGKNVKVIGKSAFARCTELQTVVCRSKVLYKIGANAFSGDKKLKKITLSTTKLTAKNVGKNAIKGTHKKLVIKVPKKVKKSYKNIFKKKGNKKVKTA